MIDAGDKMFDHGTEIPTDDRHQRLKEPEMKGETEVMPEGKNGNSAANGNGDCKCIHRQPNSNADDREKVQAGNSIVSKPIIGIHPNYSET